VLEDRRVKRQGPARKVLVVEEESDDKDISEPETGLKGVGRTWA
jgi:hypothetical protein